MIADKIKQIRKSLNLTQENFGIMMGVSRDVIANIENSRAEVSQTFIELLHYKHNVNKKFLYDDAELMFDNTVDSDFYNNKNCDNIDRKIIDTYTSLSDANKNVIKDYLQAIFDKKEV